MTIPDPEPTSEDLLQWRVWSFTGRKEKQQLVEYFVELQTMDGLNNCTCPDFQTRKKPHYNTAIRAGVPFDMIELRYCKHLKLCKELFADLMIKAIFVRSKQLDRGI